VIGTVSIRDYCHFTCDMASDSVVSENVISDRAVPEANTRRPYCGDLGSVPGQLHACGICGRQRGTGTDFFFPPFLLYHDHSNSAPFSSKLIVS
jgi:hypothetical protein